MAALPLQHDIDYPESDGRPVAETERHIDEIFDLIHALRTRYAKVPDVYVAGNMLMYYVPGNIKKSVSPDVFLVEGVSKEKRRTYKVWEEGRAPSLVIEVTSKSTWSEDLIEKKEKYARLGVKEYFLFDLLGEYLHPHLQGFRLSESWYGEIEPDADGSLTSEVTGLRFQVEGERLRLVDLATGEKLLRSAEEAEAREAAEERARAAEEEIARLRRALAEARNE
jgi:Uma2 family endonuclease